MRLRQLARKLDLKPAEIVEFLAKNDILIEEDSNTRLEDSQVKLIMMQFSANGLDDEATEHVGDDPKAEPVLEPTADQSELTTSHTTSISEDHAPEERTELIKAPKVELSGLKVLGKIELPEPKKKEPQPAELETGNAVPAAEVERKKPFQENRRPGVQNKRRPEQRSWNNPLELQREREALEAEQKRRAEAEHAKEKRTKNYFKKVKVSTPTKRAKLVDEQSMQMTEAELSEVPSSWFGRVARWFRT